MHKKLEDMLFDLNYDIEGVDFGYKKNIYTIKKIDENFVYTNEGEIFKLEDFVEESFRMNTSLRYDINKFLDAKNSH